jgi:hypothetical protein
LYAQWSAVSRRSKENKAITDLMDWGITEIKKYIRQLLNHYRRDHVLTDRHRIDEYVEIIYAVFNEHYTRCAVFGERYSLVRRRLMRRIPILFEPWVQDRQIVR